MFDNIRISVDNLDQHFIDSLREQYPHASLEIRVEEPAEYEGLTEEQFWTVVASLDWLKEDDSEAVIRPAVEKLASHPVRHIYEFQDFLAEKLHRLDTKVHASSSGENAWKGEDQFFSVDEFLYARCCVVANGKAAYETVLHDPSQMPKDLTFEALLRVARNAYHIKTGKQFRYVPSFNIETFSNRSGWEN